MLVVKNADESGRTRAFKIEDENMLEALTMLDPRAQGWAIRIIGRVTRAFSACITSKNPFFAVRNAIRDFQHAEIMDGGKLWDYCFRWGYAVGRSFVNEFRMIHGMKTDNTYLQAKASLGYGSKYYAGRGDLQIDDPSSYIVQKGNILFAPIRELFNMIEVLNGGLEMAPRLAAFEKAYKQAQKQGLSQEEIKRKAADAARNVTVDFGAKGTDIKDLANVIPFIGVSIAGLKQTQEVVASKETLTKKGVARIVRALVAQSIPHILAMVAMGIPLLGGGDDDKEEYGGLSSYLKLNYLHFKLGDTWVRLPNDREFSAIFGVTFQLGIMMAMYDGIEETGIKPSDALDYLISTFIPAHEFVWSGALQAKGNKAWYGGNIYSTSQYENYELPGYYWRITDENTSDISNLIAKGLSHIPENMQEKLGGLATPKGLDYFFDQTFGAFADIALAMTTESKGLSGLLDSLQNQYTTDPAQSNRFVNESYDILKKLKAEEQASKDDGREMDPVQAEWLKVFQNTVYASGEKDDDHKTITDYSREVKELKVDTSIPYNERQEKIHDLKLKQMIIAKELVNAYNSGEAPASSSYAEVLLPDSAKAAGFDKETYSRTLREVQSVIDKLPRNTNFAKEFAITQSDLTDYQKEFFSQKYLGKSYTDYKDEIQGYLDRGLTTDSVVDYESKVKEKKLEDSEYRTKALIALTGPYSDAEKEAFIEIAMDASGTSEKYRSKYVETFREAAEQGITPEEWQKVEAAIKERQGNKRQPNEDDIRNAVADCGYTGEKARAFRRLKRYRMS